MLPPSRLVVVSNRTALVAALDPALRTFDGVWLSWSGAEGKDGKVLAIDEETHPARASFDLPHALREHFYKGFCNQALWPLLHGFPGRARYRDEDWRAYVKVNELYARHAVQLVADDGVIWAHDFHLLLLARAARERHHAGRIGLFVHVPFPPPDVVDTLPWADTLLAAMCDFDQIGFHTEQWADNFRACLQAHGKKVPRIRVLPVGIDPTAFTPTVNAIDHEVAGLRAALGAKRMILGVDRLDYAKGIPERLLAFEALLDRYPEWRSQVSFVQVSVPSRADVPEYAELRVIVEKLVGRINGKFGEANWVPVRYLYRSYEPAVRAQLYRLADIGLVTPLRDGLNLVAKEFIASQRPDEPGVLVLSKFAGAAAELRHAVLTNPYHAEGLAADLDFALRMPAPERRRRHELSVAALAEMTPARWAATFLGQLREPAR